MKIACGHCAAQYTVADDRVHGRSFRTRCKRCAAPIVVRAMHMQAWPTQAHAVGAPSYASEGPDLFVVRSVPRPEPQQEKGVRESGERQILRARPIDAPSLPMSEPFADIEEPPPLPAPSSGASSVRPWHASGDGSGMIDMRALVQAAASKRATRSAEQSVDAFLALGDTSGFAPLNAPAPPLTPPEFGLEPPAFPAPQSLTEASDASKASKAREPEKVGWLFLTLAFGVAAVLLLGLLALDRLTGSAPVASVPPPSVVVEGPRVASAEPAPAEEAEPAAHEASAVLAALAPAAPAAPEAEEATRPSRRARAERVEAAEPAATPVAAASPAPERPSGTPSVRELMDRAVGRERPAPRPRASAPAASSLPERPSRDAVRGAMDAVLSSVQACSEGAHGRATVRLVIDGPSGRVRSANVQSDLPPAARSCIARASRGARFPAFAQDSMSIDYPFVL